MSEDIVARFKNARNWINGGRCCGQVDSAGICAAPACIFGDAARELDKAAVEITRLRAALAIARREGMEEAADLCDDLPDHQGGICAIAIRMMIDEEDKKAAIRAAGEDREP